MIEDETKHICGMILFIFFMFMLMTGLWIYSSYLEAQAFNKVTGKNISTQEAMFLELRIQEPVK